jgi:type I restriction enzyme S subunit
MIREKWKTVPIKSVYHGLYDGPHATPAPCADGPVFLGIKNVTDDGALDLTDIRHISESEFPRWTKRVNPKPGDIVFTYEATLNRYAIVPDGFRGCLGRRMALIRTNPEKIDTRFLHFYFFSKQWREVISNNTLTGATVDRIPLTKFPDFPVTIPDLPTQRNIAGILSAYDDLIENNLRRIKILEQMAQSLYREWFVHFRFPGHDTVRFIDSELGRIPKGWKVTTIGEQFTTTLGGTPSRSNDAFWTNGTVPWVNSGKVNELRIIAPTSLITEEALRRSAAKLMPVRTTVVAITGATLGQVSLLEIGCSANQSVIGITDDESRFSEWLYLFFSEKIHEIIQHASGGAQQHINKEIVNDVRLVLPDDNTAHNFGGKISPIFDQQSNLLRRNQNLRRTRDLLLSNLLSATPSGRHSVPATNT